MADPKAVLIAAPVIGGMTLLGIKALNRENRRRFQKELASENVERESLMLYASLLQKEEDAALLRSSGRGQVAILADGSFSSAQLPHLLRSYVRASAPGFVGGIYRLEPDVGRAEVSDALTPAVFQDRIATADLYLFPGGMSGRSLREVLALKHMWEPEVKRGTEQWLRIIKGGTKPAVLLAFASSGGSAALARGPIEAFHHSYPTVPIYMITILDEKTIARTRFPEIRDYYVHENLVTQWIVCDNRRFQHASDIGTALFFPGMTVAPWLKPQSIDLWNLGPYTFPLNGKVEPRFATLAMFAEMVPVKYRPPWKNYLPELYFTETALVEDVAMRGIREVVENPALQSLPLPKAKSGTARIVLVAAPLHPSDFVKNIARIEEGLDPWRKQHDIDIQLCYANIKVPMSLHTTEVPLVVVYLQPLDATDDDLDLFALGETPIAPHFLPPDENGTGERRALEG